MNDLLPCPFCGNKAVVQRDDHICYIICNGCGAQTKIFERFSAARRRWNKRYSESEQIDKAVKDAEKILKQWKQD